MDLFSHQSKEEARNLVETLVPTEWGPFIVSAHAENEDTYVPHIVLRHPDLDINRPVYVRIHSECLTGDVFHSQKCDCGAQLQNAMNIIKEEKGILIYLRQEGRGIGIINKLRAYKHQEEGLNTIEANEALGLQSDYRKYDIPGEILRTMGIKEVKLITNNPLKINGLDSFGIDVIERIPMIIEPNANSASYLKTKEEDMGHMLSNK